MEVSKCWKVVEFQKNSVKIKSCKTLYEAQTATRLKETIQAPRNSPPSGKTLLRLWNKIFLREIYRNAQKFAFKVHQESGSWASRKKMLFLVQCKCFFWQETETCLLENLQSQKGDLLLENLKIKKTLMMFMFIGTCGRIWKRCIPEKIFSKKESQIWCFESCIFWSKFCFWGQL